MNAPGLPASALWSGATEPCDVDVGRYAPSACPLYVHFADVDMMQVVHHAAYLHWFERIRFKFLNDVLGVPFSALLESGVALPLTSCEVQYRRSVRFGDEPVGYARAQVFRQARVVLHYAIHLPSGALAATGRSTHCFLGPQHRLLLNWPDFFTRAVQTAYERDPGCFVHRSPAEAPC